MLEMMQATRKKGSGYYLGETASSQLITGVALAAAIGLTVGSVSADAGWLKFTYKGKTLYIAKKPFRQSMSWNNLYATGAVYGDDTNGALQGATPRLQNARVTIGSVVHRVRLMRVVDPLVADTVGSELKDLLLNVLAVASGGTGVDATFSAADLNMGAGLQYYWWTLNAPSTNSALRYMAGLSDNAPVTAVLTGLSPSTNFSFPYWRPVLEVI